MDGKRIIKSIALLIVISVLILTVIMIGGNRQVKAVAGFECASSFENGVNLKWKENPNADGYIIYEKDISTDDIKELIKISDAKVTSYCVKSLEQATKYDFVISAFSQRGKKIKESEDKSELTIYTSPSSVELQSVTYIEEGNIDVKWSENEKAAGYEVQYSDNEDFKNPETVKTESNETSLVIEDLNKESAYYLRVRSYISADGGEIYSDWGPEDDIVSYEEFKEKPEIDPDKPMIALTFDDGPGYNDASRRILDVFEKNNARATFFMVGINAADQPDNIKRKISLGCELGNHTNTHQHLGSKVTPDDIKKCSDAIYNVCGERPTCFRSPGGSTTTTIKNECVAENMALYYWSLDTNDWKFRDSNRIYNYVMNNVKDGDIVLMHDIYPTTADAVERMVPELIAKGYQLVTVSELVEAKTGSAPVAGQEYITAKSIKN